MVRPGEKVLGGGDDGPEKDGPSGRTVQSGLTSIGV